MWLVLRVLQHQEEYIIQSNQTYTKMFKDGKRLFANPSEFISECSNLQIGLAFLPRYFRTPLRPKKVGEIILEPIGSKIRDLDSIIRDASNLGYIETAKQLGKKPMNPNKGREDAIRISPKGDDFVTYFGGLETLVKKYPQAWAFLILTLSPSWLPWIVKHIVPFFLNNGNK